MSQFSSGPSSTPRQPASNVYTVLLLIAVLALATGVGVTWWQNVQLTGHEQPNAAIKNPFYLNEPVGS